MTTKCTERERFQWDTVRRPSSRMTALRYVSERPALGVESPHSSRVPDSYTFATRHASPVLGVGSVARGQVCPIRYGKVKQPLKRGPCESHMIRSWTE
jgi:hypothetical protein